MSEIRSRPEIAPRALVVEHRAQADRALAQEIAGLVRERRRIVLGLATGDTPSGVYAELARMRREEGLDLREVVTFVLDEYLDLSPGHAASFSRFVRERLARDLGLSQENVRVPDADPVEPAIDERCRAYEDSIRAAGGIDLQILGVGRNGHVAFNEPGSARDSRTREVELHPWTREDAAPAFGGIGMTPLRAITMGIETIFEARRLRILAFGRRKSGIVKEFLEGPIGREVPATFLRIHPDLRIWLDREAAVELSVLRPALEGRFESR